MGVRKEYEESTCSKCGGEGTSICGTCSGSGHIVIEDQSVDYIIPITFPICKECKGLGYVNCEKCSGEGTQTTKRKHGR